MFTQKHKQSWVRVILPVFVFSLLSTPLSGETSSDTIQQITNVLGEVESGNFDTLTAIGNNNAFLEEMTATIPPPPPAVPSGGRKDKAGGAKAAAIIGAVMGFTSCAMMMAAAQKMEPGPEKTMMMAQAMQQCGQAGANLANAADNGDAEDAVTSGPAQMPKVAKAIPATLPKSGSGRRTVASNRGSSNSPSRGDNDSIDSFALPDPGDVTIPDLTQQTTGDDFVADDLNFDITPEGAPKALAAINHPKVGFNEDLEEDGLGNGRGVLFAGAGSARGLDGGLPGLGGLPANGGVPDRGRLDGLIRDSGAGGIPGGSLPGGKGKFSLSKLLGKLGNKGGGIQAPPGDLIQLPLKKKGGKNGKRLNIFEYASYRYIGITNQGRVRTGPLAKVVDPSDTKVATK